MVDLPDGMAKIQRLTRVAQAFTPSAPIDDLELFAGRLQQVQTVVNAVVQKGQHVALYGERGVGKTSLANILGDLFNAPDLPQFRAVKVNCDSSESFDSLWRKIYRELQVESERGDNELRPDDIRYDLDRIGTPALIVLDELDRFDDDEALTLLADTVKSLSDHAVSSTLVLVGVAASVEGLVGEHESIARALVKVHMPRMPRHELREILEKGCTRAGIGAQHAAADKIVVLSQGLPHFTHLLALHAGQRAVQNDRIEITLGDVNAAVPTAVGQHAIETDYLKATHSAHADSLYPSVLLACALAPQDEFGFFTAGSIREPLREIAGRQIAIPQFARHLKQFLEPDRGSVLRRDGVKHRFLYRFRDPIVQTYVVLHGLSSGLIDGTQLETLEGWQATVDPPIVPEQLF
jgi:hypothetical protein